MTDLRPHYLAIAEALPAGTTFPVPRELLLELLMSADVCKTPEASPDRWLTAVQVGKLLGVPERWVYNHAAQLGGKRLSRRCLRFPEAGVQRYLERRR